MQRYIVLVLGVLRVHTSIVQRINEYYSTGCTLVPVEHRRIGVPYGIIRVLMYSRTMTKLRVQRQHKLLKRVKSLRKTCLNTDEVDKL